MLFAAAATVLGGAFVLASGPARGVVMLASIAGPTAAIVVLLVRGRLQVPRSWLVVLGLFGLLAVNGAVWLRPAGSPGHVPPTGILVDLAVILGFMCLLSGSALILAPFARRDRGGILDAAILGVGAASVLWTLIAPNLTDAADATEGRRVYAMVGTVLSTTVASMVGRAATTSRRARAPLGYVCVAVVLTLAGIAGQVLTRPHGGPPSLWFGLTWIIAFVALGSAALHPARALLDELASRTPDRLSGGRLVALGVAMALNPAIAGALALRGRAIDWTLLCVTSVAIIPLVLTRIAQLAAGERAAEGELARIANHDALTGLLNRRVALLRLDEEMDLLDAGRLDALTVVFLDVDGLKVVNDAHGHAAGDALLVGIAERLQAAVRDGDLVARLGGDEFVVVSPGPVEVVGRNGVERIRAALAAPVVWNGIVLPAVASLGTVTAVAGQFRSADQMLALADLRMYEDKRSRGRRGEDAVLPITGHAS